MKILEEILGKIGSKTMGALIKSYPQIRGGLICQSINRWLKQQPEGNLVIPLLKSDCNKSSNFTYNGKIENVSFNDYNSEQLSILISNKLGVLTKISLNKSVDVDKLNLTLDLLIKANTKPNTMDEPEGNIAPEPPTRGKPKLPRKTRAGNQITINDESVTFKMLNKTSLLTCVDCEAPYLKDGQLCFCLRGLSKNAKITKSEEGWDITTFNWEKSALERLQSLVR